MTVKNRISVEISDGLRSEISPSIEVRDNKFKLLKLIHSTQFFELDDGIFEVSAVLIDGNRHSKILNLNGDGSRHVVLGYKPDRLIWDASDEAEITSLKVEHFTNFRVAEHSFSIPRNLKSPILKSEILRLQIDGEDDTLNFSPAELSTSISKHKKPDGSIAVHATKKSDLIGRFSYEDENIELLAIEESEVIDRFRDKGDHSCSWMFGPLGMNPQSVPTALFSVYDKNIRISLPVTGQNIIPGAAEVKIIFNNNVFDVDAWIAPTGRKARNMQQLLSSGYILNAAQEAAFAEQLLFDKYADPVGAVLGGIIMHKIGTLSARSNWVENLVDRFDWLNDGKVLQAIIMLEHQDDPKKIFSLLSEASKKRMMFTEAYSLFINILRHWSWSEYKDECNEILNSLARTTSSLKWDSVFMCEILTGGEQYA